MEGSFQDTLWTLPAKSYVLWPHKFACNLLAYYGSRILMPMGQIPRHDIHVYR
jgi:hypothetical protein